jgi:hypothetical protein
MIEENKRASSTNILNQIESKIYRQRFSIENTYKSKFNYQSNQVDAYHHGLRNIGRRPQRIRRDNLNKITEID